MIDLWREPWFGWALGVAIGLPVLLVLLTEVYAALLRRNSPAAKPVRLLRNFVLPVAAVFALLTFASQQSFDLTWVRIVGTVLGFLLILLVLSAFNVALFGNAREGSWRERLPSIFVTLARLALILVGLAILFSWVWGADVGGLFAALGVTSIVIGLALQNAVGSIISGLLLLFEQPFKLGDFLDVGDVRGRVVEVNWRSVHIDTGNGIQIMPNSSLAGGSFTNLSQPVGVYVASVPVKFTTDDAPHAVLSTLLETAGSLPHLDPADKPSVSYEGNAAYTVALPVTSPAVEEETVSLFLAWLWYAARRNDLGLDGDTTDPVNTTENVIDALSFVGPGLKLPQEDLDGIAASCRLEQYGAGETLQGVGVVPDSVRVVLSGVVELSVPYEQGRLRIGVVERGEFIGQAALTRQKTSTVAVASRPVTVLRVPSSVVDDMVHKHPSLARRIGETLDNRRRLAADAVAAARAASGSIAA
ncbi:mechanosensitive ion channel domain-containing protein [Agreia sp.]|uniref:mechanosensitive ion channel domain-containing protein n=1 Tax=Agreia sp. TaxID=1872416 RepID=UPI0035BC3B27